jgi:hypothetical protein
MMPLVSAILDCIPEGLLNLGIPIALDQVFKSFSVGRGGIRDVWSIVSRVYAWGIDGKKANHDRRAIVPIQFRAICCKLE